MRFLQLVIICVSKLVLSVPVLAFAIVLSILTGLAMGVYPAWQSSRADLVDGLKEGGRGTSGSVKQQRFRKILVGAQVALSVTLLAGAALLIASFVRLNRQDLGFRSDNLWTGFITLPAAPYPDIATRARFEQQLMTALQAVPGFEQISLTGDVPLIGGNRTLYTKPEGNVLPVAERAAAPSHDVAPGYFKTWGIPLLSGRDFDEHDLMDHQNVMLISQAGARKVFGNENPIGKVLLTTSSSVPTEIIGVVGDVRSQRVAQRNEMEFYRPWAQENFPFLTMTVRSKLPTLEITRLTQKSSEQHRSRARHCAAATDVGDRRAGARPSAIDDHIARYLCRRGVAACDGRNLWRSRLHRRATHR